MSNTGAKKRTMWEEVVNRHELHRLISGKNCLHIESDEEIHSYFDLLHYMCYNMRTECKLDGRKNIVKQLLFLHLPYFDIELGPFRSAVSLDNFMIKGEKKYSRFFELLISLGVDLKGNMHGVT